MRFIQLSLKSCERCKNFISNLQALKNGFIASSSFSEYRENREIWNNLPATNSRKKLWNCFENVRAVRHCERFIRVCIYVSSYHVGKTRNWLLNGGLPCLYRSTKHPMNNPISANWFYHSHPAYLLDYICKKSTCHKSYPEMDPKLWSAQKSGKFTNNKKAATLSSQVKTVSSFLI